MPVDIAEPTTHKTLEKSWSSLEPTEKLTQKGIHQESKLSLYSVVYNRIPQASVFIYPSTYVLTPSRICERDNNFLIMQSTPIIHREFKDTAMEDLSRQLLELTRPLPFLSRRYPIPKPEIITHSFDERAAEYLTGVIKDLKG